MPPEEAMWEPESPSPEGASAKIEAQALASAFNTEQATPEQATSEQATSEQATPEQATPEQATPEQATPEQATPEQATPEQATPEQATPEQATPEQATPEQATPEQATALPYVVASAAENATQAGREAGLVAARELVDTANYNRWSEGVLAGNNIDKLDTVRERAFPQLLFVSILVCSLLLLAQVAYYFRTEISLRLPPLAALYDALAIDVPLPKHSGLLAIEDSDLQSDPKKGVYVLQATLKNRAPYAQAWPALELTLTDVNDAIVARRVISEADYLTASSTPPGFEANGERAVNLQIDAKNLVASGYRLYLFYY